MIVTIALTVAAFAAGTKYGQRIEKEAVTVALAAFTKAKTVLFGTITRAQTDAAREVARLEAIAKKYL